MMRPTVIVYASASVTAEKKAEAAQFPSLEFCSTSSTRIWKKNWTMNLVSSVLASLLEILRDSKRLAKHLYNLTI